MLMEAADSPLLETEADLYHGAAGVGVAALALGTSLRAPELVDVAERMAQRLLRSAERRRHGIAWSGRNGVIPCGLAQGGSGISLFFTYLGAATGDPGHWDTARAALDFELSQVKWRAGYAFWPPTGGTRRRRSHSPHVFYGAAGVGAAVLRLHACTGADDLLGWAERCAATTAFRWTNKLWQDYGYAGYGETALDMFAATGRPQYRAHALRMAQVLLPNLVTTPYGQAFPGGALNRVSSDFGMGTSGIAMFLLRVIRPAQGRAFFPDHLLPRWNAAAEPVPTALASAA
jgi:lantibiotic modifying enzyme